ncbi:MAG: porin [Planctomycetota bacterium]|nr:porin [Planctomycetota bacterium]
MKKLVYSALALTLSGAPALATDNGWSGLDKEIESLSSSLQSANPNAPGISGWVLASYRHSSDIDANGTATGTPDQSGFQLDSVRLEVEGDAGNDYSYKVSMDLAGGNGSLHGESPSGTVGLRDAYVKWSIYEGINGKIGRFKESMLRSALVSDNRLILLDRTNLGELLDRRDLGLAVYGSFDVLNWTVQAQDGTDGQADEHRFVLRATANVVGKAGDSKNEGAYGAGEETNVVVGIAFQDEGNLADGQIIALEAGMTAGPFSVAAELVDFDKGDAGTFGLTDTFVGNDVADTTPWDITVSYLITPEYEVAGRFEDADDVDDTTSYTLGVNRYVRGHDIKWGAQWKAIKTDNAVGDIDQLGVGVGVSF